jgi:hypothetical protein
VCTGDNLVDVLPFSHCRRWSESGESESESESPDSTWRLCLLFCEAEGRSRTNPLGTDTLLDILLCSIRIYP